MSDTNTPDPVLVELADAILRVARELESHSVTGAGLKTLTGTEATVLRWVHRNPRCSPSAAAEATGLQRSNLSTALRGLTAKGLVERHRDATDSRQVSLDVTDSAREGIAALNATWSQIMADALGAQSGQAVAAVTVLGLIDDYLRRER